MDTQEESKGQARKVSRRKAIQVLGMGVGSAAILAACGDTPTNTAAPTQAAATTAAGSATTAATSATTAAGSAATTAASGSATTAAVSGVKATGKVVMATGRDPSGTVKKIIDDFNKLNNGITIEYQELEQDSSANKQKYSTVFAAKDSSIDVIAADIPWVPEFGSAGFLLDLNKYLTPDLRAQFYEGTIEGATWKGKLYGLPWYINVGLLYYRKDILDAAGLKPPETFEELEKQAAQLQKVDQGLYGFIHHGFQNEGLAGTWLEVLWGYGGEYWDPATAEAKVNSPEGIKALQWWYDNVYTRKITPEKVSGWKAADIRNVFNEGNAVFMRDWFDGYQPSQDATKSKVAGKVGVRPMVAAAGKKGAGCLGNWYMGVSAFSKNPDAAYEVVKYMTSSEAAVVRAIGTGLPPGNKNAYQNKELLEKYPSFAFLTDVLATAKPRPVTPAYNQISANVIQIEVTNVLTKKSTPEQAAKSMADKSKDLLAKFK
jgi:multiple sugar transport system substrate-binding protein